jgi:hypothetical protein
VDSCCNCEQQQHEARFGFVYINYSWIVNWHHSVFLFSLIRVQGKLTKIQYSIDFFLSKKSQRAFLHSITLLNNSGCWSKELLTAWMHLLQSDKYP